ncbi:MAG: transcription antitermination factor NusB [Opitutales bacterium]
MEGGIDNQVEPKSKFSKRQRQRQCIVECLYMWEMQRDLPVEELFAAYCEEKRENVEEEVLQADFVLDSLKGVSNYSDVLDEKIRNCAKNWSFSRIAKMDLAILRLAIYELFFVKTPAPIVINEAVELSKIYSSDDAKRFINGILDYLSKEAVK